MTVLKNGGIPIEEIKMMNVKLIVAFMGIIVGFIVVAYGVFLLFDKFGLGLCECGHRRHTGTCSRSAKKEIRTAATYGDGITVCLCKKIREVPGLIKLLCLIFGHKKVPEEQQPNAPNGKDRHDNCVHCKKPLK